MLHKKSKKGQEEMVGFALIVIIVAIIILFFLVISLRNNGKENVESYEAESFLQSALQYTTDCGSNSGFSSVQDLVFDCDTESICVDGREACQVLNSTLKELASAAWPVGPNRPKKGYELLILENNVPILELKEGNVTTEYKGAVQSLPGNIDVSFRVYS